MSTQEAKTFVVCISGIPILAIADDHPEVLALADKSVEELVEVLWKTTSKANIDLVVNELNLANGQEDEQDAKIGDYDDKTEHVAQDVALSKAMYLALQVEAPLEAFDTDKFVQVAKAELFKDVELKDVNVVASALSPKKRTTLQALVPEDFDVSTIAPGSVVGGYKIAEAV